MPDTSGVNLTVGSLFDVSLLLEALGVVRVQVYLVAFAFGSARSTPRVTGTPMETLLSPVVPYWTLVFPSDRVPSSTFGSLALAVTGTILMSAFGTAAWAGGSAANSVPAVHVKTTATNELTSPSAAITPLGFNAIVWFLPLAFHIAAAPFSSSECSQAGACGT